MTSFDIAADSRRVYSLLLEGGTALLPTNIGYGLVAMKERAVARIYELKGRPASKPCVTVATWPIFDDVSLPLAPELRAWVAETLLQSPLAIITRLNPKSRLLRSFEPYVLSQSTQGDTIATFHGAGDLIRAVALLAHQDGKLVVGSSANTSGTGNNYNLDEVPESIKSSVDLVLDYGAARYANEERMATTLLDLTRNRFQRKGIDFERIERSWQAFCRRSPVMAAEN
ncbi:MAG: Sua5/YciO/YrdC/YwlC family protein [Myxococcales bacterium]|nr:Sua5/YciO/YrdC/YwlC family protein [Myxococcales bacterium]